MTQAELTFLTQVPQSLRSLVRVLGEINQKLDFLNPVQKQEVTELMKELDLEITNKEKV